MSTISRISFLLACLLLAITADAFAPVNLKVAAPSSTKLMGSAVAMGSPAVLEKESTVLERAFEVADRPTTKTTREPARERKSQGHEAWEVRIYNDGLNTREHVARSLVQVTGMSELIAYQTMMQAHQNGIAVVGRFMFEVAEMYHEELKRNGIVCDIIPVGEDS